MTADEVLEAMARAIFMRGLPHTLPFEEARQNDPDCWQEAIEDARAAIRALPTGWMVAKVPESISIPNALDVPKNLTAGQIAHIGAVGWNDAIAAFRASAVEVG